LALAFQNHIAVMGGGIKTTSLERKPERKHMKKIYFATIIILIFGFSECDSQLISSYGAKIGITSAGQDWNYSGILSGMSIYDKYRTGLDIGGYVEWFSLPVFSVLTEAHYIQKGCKDVIPITTLDSPDGNGATITRAPRIDYLSFPLLAKIRFDTPILTIYGIAGYRIDFLIAKNSDASGEVFDDFKSTDYGPTIGFGISVSNVFGYCLGGEFRYSFSSQEIFSNQVLTVKNKSMELLLTVGF